MFVKKFFMLLAAFVTPWAMIATVTGKSVSQFTTSQVLYGALVGAVILFSQFNRICRLVERMES